MARNGLSFCVLDVFCGKDRWSNEFRLNGRGYLCLEEVTLGASLAPFDSSLKIVVLIVCCARWWFQIFF